MRVDPGVLEQVSSELQAYVYLLVDPRTGVPFYVGKGHGLRHAAHVAEALIAVDESAGERSRKHGQIDDLRAVGLEPDVWILRYGLKPGEYTAVEASAIDLLMSFPVRLTRDRETRIPLGSPEAITNARREAARGHGVTTLQSLIDEYGAPELATRTPLLLITLNGWTDLADGETIAGGRVRYGAGFKSEWLVSSARRQSYDRIGESVSAWWNLSRRQLERRGIEHVAAMHRGVTRALFKIDPDSWETVDRDRTDKNGRPITKSAFWFHVIDSGPLFDQVVGPHGHRVPGRAKGAQNALYYWPR